MRTVTTVKTLSTRTQGGHCLLAMLVAAVGGVACSSDGPSPQVFQQPEPVAVTPSNTTSTAETLPGQTMEPQMVPSSETVVPVSSPGPGNEEQGPISPVSQTAGVEAQPLPVDAACASTPPTSFAARCASCHSASGSQSARFPDLFQYSGDSDAFRQLVRDGRNAMPAFDAATLSDAELEQMYAHFSGGQRVAPSPLELGVQAPRFMSAAQNPAIVHERADGALITRGAGRVRQRHELEGTFNSFGSRYFEDRSYGFIIEDLTPTGQSLVRIYYLPLAQPTAVTNFRAWKIMGNGNVFYRNSNMEAANELPQLGFTSINEYESGIAPFANVQFGEVTDHAREDRDMQAGDVLEFEFGIFLDRGAVHPDSRTAYYTDTFRYLVGKGGLTSENQDPSGDPGPQLTAQLGGNTTNVWLYEDRKFTFGQPALNVQHENVQRFLEGRRLFHTDFATGAHSELNNPDSAAHAGLAGPQQVTATCTSCHPGNGSGAPFTSFDQTEGMAFKLFGASGFGKQLQLDEGSVVLAASQTEEVVVGGGETVQLTKPQFELSLADGSAAKFSARNARPLIGLGLLEAIADEDLLSRADPEDCDGDGISGRPSLVVDPRDGALRIGRLGWKAEKVDVEHQVADALRSDMGVETSVFPDTAAELSDDDLQRLTTYMRLLAVPGQRDAMSTQVQSGETLFRDVGCTSCHSPFAVTTSQHPFAELRSQEFRPFTDLLLHDMGAALADDSAVPAAAEATGAPSASEWRTPPLWGVGLRETVNGNVQLLHDGRANTVQEAVLWHGGEAQAARDRFVKLSADERAALVAFVKSL